jgi:hypothetical protein
MDRADWTPEMSGRLLRSQTLQQAEYDRLTVLLRQAAHLIVDCPLKVVVIARVSWKRR